MCEFLCELLCTARPKRTHTKCPPDRTRGFTLFTRTKLTASFRSLRRKSSIWSIKMDGRCACSPLVAMHSLSAHGTGSRSTSTLKRHDLQPGQVAFCVWCQRLHLDVICFDLSVCSLIIVFIRGTSLSPVCVPRWPGSPVHHPVGITRRTSARGPLLRMENTNSRQIMCKRSLVPHLPPTVSPLYSRTHTFSLSRSLSRFATFTTNFRNPTSVIVFRVPPA